MMSHGHENTVPSVSINTYPIPQRAVDYMLCRKKDGTYVLQVRDWDYRLGAWVWSDLPTFIEPLDA